MLHGRRYIDEGNDVWVDHSGDGPGQWRREWIEIAAEDGVPFIADISQPGVPVYAATEISAAQVDLVHNTIAEFIDAIQITPMSEIMPDFPER